MRTLTVALACKALALGTLVASISADASETGKSVYLLGTNASMSGFTPPPGAYFSSLFYYYTGNASGAAALTHALPQLGASLPGKATLKAKASLNVNADVSLTAFSMLWVAPEKFLGANFGAGAVLPVGYQNVEIDVRAKAALTLPNGTTIKRNRSISLNDNTFEFGDPMATAFLGWSSGNVHWKLTGLVNIPVGAYDRHSPVNMGFNHWAADVTGSMTWLDMKTGLELSVASGFTFNAENPATNYKTGTEFHTEAAAMSHVSKDFAFGLAGYYYRQLTADSGRGAVLGAFKGEVAALGPNLTYNFHVGNTPVLTSFRWLHEFHATNRLEGDAAFLTVTIPLGGAPVAH